MAKAAKEKPVKEPKAPRTAKVVIEEPLEKQLWKAADKLRKNIDAAEYKHVVLGLIFLKYISDAFEEVYAQLKAAEAEGADPEDKDEYLAGNVFFVPTEARWTHLLAQAKQPKIGTEVDNAMDAIERDNPSLKGVLPKVYARQNLDPTVLGELIDLIGNIAMGTAKARSADVLGHVFEYFLGEFALAEGKQGGQFYTPRSIVELLVDMLAPYKGRVFDPCCGSGGMFVQSEKFVEEHQGKIDDISIYGQESNQTTWRLAKMNLAIRGIDSSQVKWNNEGSFLKDAHTDLKADFIIAKPPSKLSVGQRGTFYVCMKLATDPFGSPFVFDQPEDDLDNNFIMKELVPIFRQIKKYRQVIIATHNANLVVNADAEQVIVANNINEMLSYVSGSIENTNAAEPRGIREQVCDILEGGDRAFKQREQRYAIK